MEKQSIKCRRPIGAFRSICHWNTLISTCATAMLFLHSGAVKADAFAPYDPSARAGLWYSTQNCLVKASSYNTWAQTGQNKCLVPEDIYKKQQAGNPLAAPYLTSYVLHWISAKGQVVLVPSVYVSGVESNQININSPDASIILPDWWSEAMRWVEQLTAPTGKVFKVPQGGGIGVALNSASIRSEDQLHLHLCTVPAALITDIKAQKPSTDQWNTKSVFADGKHKWYVMKVSSRNINAWQWVLQPPTSHNPPKTDDHPNTGGIEIQGDYANKANISMMFVKTSDSTPAFYLLFNQVDLDPAHGKDFGSDAERLFSYKDKVDTKCNGAVAPQ
jgi:CDP-diacylglycerol pyrophosphatase